MTRTEAEAFIASLKSLRDGADDQLAARSNGVTYRCTISTGQAVYHALSDLVGLYVEVA